jgi:outer membrane protein assembly factor BamB
MWRASSKFVIVFAVGLLILLPSGAQARGTGLNYFLLSPEGKLIWQYEWSRADLVDVEAELVYRVHGGELTATAFGQREPVWKVKSPLAEADFLRRYSCGWHCGPSIVCLISDTAIYAFDSKSGTAKYTIPIGPYDALGVRDFLQRTVAPTAPWEPRSNRYRYLAKQTKPLGIAKFDLLQGKFLWEKALPPVDAEKMEVGAVVPGVVEIALGNGDLRYFFFNDGSGELLTKLPIETDKSLQVSVGDGLLYHLSKDKTPTLTAFDIAAQKPVWNILGLVGVDRFVGTHQHGRLLCAGGKELLVIDTQQKRIVARFPVSGPNTFTFDQSASNLLIEDQGSLCLIDPQTGKEKWRMNDFVKSGSGVSFCLTGATAKDEDRFIVVTPPKGQGRMLGVVEARSLKDGKVAWSWNVPYIFGDSTSIHVTACRSGFLVKRSWLVLD